MITEDLIEFLISKQGQRIAVRFDPSSPVWKDETEPDLPPTVAVKMEKWMSAKTYIPPAVGNDSFMYASLFSFYDTGDLYLMTSTATANIPDLGEDDEMTSSSLLHVPMFKSLDYQVGKPMKAIDIAFYNWDSLMAEELTKYTKLSLLMDSGEMKLFKWSKGTNKWREQVSLSRIKAFSQLVNAELKNKSLQSSRMVSFTLRNSISGYPTLIYFDHIGNVMGKQIKENGWADVQSISYKSLQDLMITMISGKIYPVKQVDFMKEMMVGAKLTKPKNTTNFDKFKSDSWHVYNVPDCDIRSEDGINLIEQFDDFLVDLIKKGG